MDTSLQDLYEECERAAQEFLSIRGWACQKSKVEVAVAEIRRGSRAAGSSMSWLLDQIAKLPVQEQPARRLNDLVQALMAVKAHEVPADAPHS